MNNPKKKESNKKKKKEKRFEDRWEIDESSDYPVHEKYVKEENFKEI